LATNAGLMGVSRLAFSLGRHNLIPAGLSRVHRRFKTPYISIIVFGLVAVAILIPGLFASNVFIELGALYVFGSLLSFVFAHTSILALRIKKPELPRPFKLGWNIKFRERDLPMTAIIGLIGTGVIWIVVMWTQPFSRWFGLSWIAVGLLIYGISRWSKRLTSNKQHGD